MKISLRSTFSRWMLSSVLLAFVLLALGPTTVEAQRRGRGRNRNNGNNNAGNNNNTGDTGNNAGDTGNNAGDTGNNAGDTGNNDQVESPFLDRASFVPARLNVNQLDQFFTKQSEFCDLMRQFGSVPADGTQIRTGVCVSTAMGALPRVEQMPSQLIVLPRNGATVDRTQDIVINVKVSNLATGFFDNPNAGYYIAPQTLNNQGIIEGHSHFTVQQLDGGENNAPNAQNFVFFKGVNDPADGSGVLTATIPANTIKSDGVHRICTISGTFSHQPVIMPVAQRGAQDDCIRVQVTAGGGNNNNFVGNSNAASGAGSTTTKKASKKTKTTTSSRRR